jgi:hypothetical protein
MTPNTRLGLFSLTCIIVTAMIVWTMIQILGCNTPPKSTPAAKAKPAAVNTLDLWTNAGEAEAWLANMRAMHSSMGPVKPPKERWILMATLASDGQSSTVAKTKATCAKLKALGWTLAIGVGHPPIYEYEDQFRVETWRAVANAFDELEEYGGDEVAYDIEHYLVKGQKYPYVEDWMTDGWRLADACRPLIDWLHANDKSLVIEQASERHLFVHIMRINGIRTIWADSKMKPMPYSVDNPDWITVGVGALAIAHSSGAQRWPVLQSRGLVEPDAIRRATDYSDGRVGFYFNDGHEKQCDPMAKWRYPLKGWADKLKECGSAEPGD